MTPRYPTLLSLLAACVLGAVCALAAPARAEEGMWTFDNFPVRTVNSAYGTHIDQAWLDRLRASAVRLSGCSGSIVSSEGLVLTNTHCVATCVQQLSSAEDDHAGTGWTPETRDEERACPGQRADVLIDIVDVTDRIRAASTGLDGAAFVQAWGAAEDAITNEACGADPDFICQIVSFHRGGRYALYKYRTYTDVRLAFSPEFKAAFFGGWDPLESTCRHASLSIL